MYNFCLWDAICAKKKWVQRKRKRCTSKSSRISCVCIVYLCFFFVFCYMLFYIIHQKKHINFVYVEETRVKWIKEIKKFIIGKSPSIEFLASTIRWRRDMHTYMRPRTRLGVRISLLSVISDPKMYQNKCFKRDSTYLMTYFSYFIEKNIHEMCSKYKIATHSSIICHWDTSLIISWSCPSHDIPWCITRQMYPTKFIVKIS